MARSLGISEKRLLGWEATEYHVPEYDSEGRWVRTVVTRDAEWDDFEREKMVALAIYEAEVCDCGMHKSVADEDPDLELTRRRCPVCAGLAQRLRQIAAQDEKDAAALGKSPAPETPRPDDGRHFGIRWKAPNVALLDAAARANPRVATTKSSS